ncbi:sugar phosphate isomerase/epimerase family protein [Geodermatophilus sp. CPCC 206100]|uniref:sugar phosphate isomerase/epimerase family protein n=1 Tax=Geodermatophilus sp. CPCC 206100 TaxID=3020054 RepID=UPI003B008178
MTAGRVVSLSAGTVLDATPEEALAAAAAAGFDAFGTRWDPERLPRAAIGPLRRRVDDSGLALLDLEVVRLGPGVPVPDHRPWADVAAELGARFLLVVSSHDDPARAADELATLAGWCAPAGVTVALEFMRFTAVPTLRAAGELVRAAGGAGLTVLVDVLHLQRGGESADDLTAPGAPPVGYLQLCDAPAAPPGDLAALAAEARHGRLFPGEGELPLADVLAALPADLPVCVEVQSDSWSRQLDVPARARRARDSVRDLLGAPDPAR